MADQRIVLVWKPLNGQNGADGGISSGFSYHEFLLYYDGSTNPDGTPSPAQFLRGGPSSEVGGDTSSNHCPDDPEDPYGHVLAQTGAYVKDATPDYPLTSNPDATFNSWNYGDSALN